MFDYFKNTFRLEINVVWIRVWIPAAVAVLLSQSIGMPANFPLKRGYLATTSIKQLELGRASRVISKRDRHVCAGSRGGKREPTGKSGVLGQLELGFDTAEQHR